MQRPQIIQQRGITLVGLIFILAIVGLIGVLLLKVLPTVTEYFSIKKAITSVRASGGTVREMQVAFDKQADVGYIESITGKDLEIVKDGTEIQISFAYQKKIPLFGPASLLLEYEGSAGNISGKKPLDK